MILTEEQMDELFSPARNGLISTKYRWPNKTVPYRLTHEHTREQRDYIELAVRKIESVSCLKFVRQTNQPAYIQITVSCNRYSNNFEILRKLSGIVYHRRITLVVIL